MLMPAFAMAQDVPAAKAPEMVEQKMPDEGGTATVQVEIDANGKPLMAKITKSSGNKSLDDAALEAVMKSEYRAGKDEKGRSVGAVISIDYEFTPEEDEAPEEPKPPKG